MVYTDGETRYGRIHPVQALQQYRERTGIPVKLMVQAFVANRFSIAGRDDAGMLDVIGFDTAVPSLIRDFAANRACHAYSGFQVPVINPCGRAASMRRCPAVAHRPISSRFATTATSRPRTTIGFLPSGQVAQ